MFSRACLTANAPSRHRQTNPRPCPQQIQLAAKHEEASVIASGVEPRQTRKTQRRRKAFGWSDSLMHCVIKGSDNNMTGGKLRDRSLCSHKSWDAVLFLIWWRSLDIVSSVSLMYYRVGALIHESVGEGLYCRLEVPYWRDLCEFGPGVTEDGGRSWQDDAHSLLHLCAKRPGQSISLKGEFTQISNMLLIRLVWCELSSFRDTGCKDVCRLLNSSELFPKSWRAY